MGWCMFHSCEEVATLGEQDLARHGVEAREDGVLLYV